MREGGLRKCTDMYREHRHRTGQNGNLIPNSETYGHVFPHLMNLMILPSRVGFSLLITKKPEEPSDSYRKANHYTSSTCRCSPSTIMQFHQGTQVNWEGEELSRSHFQQVRPRLTHASAKLDQI